MQRQGIDLKRGVVWNFVGKKFIKGSIAKKKRGGSINEKSGI